jgi:hypothetical protein
VWTVKIFGGFMKNKKILIRAFIGLLILMSFGCKSAPAPSASTHHVGMDLDTAIREAAIQMETRIPSGTMVALVSVASPSTAFSTQVLTRLESAIVTNGKLVVVDRANLDKVRAEQGFQLSGEVSDESAKAIGQLLGAGAIVTGSLTDLGDVYNLTLKAINIETATVAVSYLADLAKTTRIETLLATRDGAGASGTSPSRTQATATTASTSSTPPAAPRQYTVTFNSNGASGRAPSAQIVPNGESINVPDVGAMSNSRGNFNGWNTRADGTGTPYAAGVTFVVNANSQLFAQWVEKVYNIGDRGPAGGWIFFDMGFYIDGWRYLEAAPQDFPTKAKWSTQHNISGTETGIGSGLRNTANLVRQLNNSGQTMRAAQVVSIPKYNGFEDWFLPSKDELLMMYSNLKLKGIGGFSNDFYWSSSNGRLSGIYSINFADGRSNDGGFIDSDLFVRAVRRF